MPQSTVDNNETEVNLEETTTVSKVWLDSLLGNLQSRIGGYEVNISSLQINLEIEKGRSQKLQAQIDQLSQRIVTNANTDDNAASSTRDG